MRPKQLIHYKGTLQGQHISKDNNSFTKKTLTNTTEVGNQTLESGHVWDQPKEGAKKWKTCHRNQKKEERKKEKNKLINN